MGCTGAVSKSLLASPICKLHDCLRWWLFLTEWICERGSCLSCYQCTFNSVSSFSCLRLFLSPSLTLPLLPLFAASLPLPGSCGLPGSFAIQGFITLVMIAPGCSASCPHASLCPIIKFIPTVGLEKEALGLKLLHSVTKGYWPIQM